MGKLCLTNRQPIWKKTRKSRLTIRLLICRKDEKITLNYQASYLRNEKSQDKKRFKGAIKIVLIKKKKPLTQSGFSISESS
ncbi:hypothetical protein IX83_05960 [Basilea psittacipulmonis DSM 24701]|uniref:Uncharacterized protein n=1 Tax=Basilea psittacipulmonis DSM 24701 TaxID=1072685 RepID=A0A077DDH6_9BURK|nr:hypothetical protein IX83_05960 [Basilea psittacipulmonis DSM 24701]